MDVSGGLHVVTTDQSITTNVHTQKLIQVGDGFRTTFAQMMPTHSGLSDTEYVYKSVKSHVHELCLQFGIKVNEVGMWLEKMYHRLVNSKSSQH